MPRAVQAEDDDLRFLSWISYDDDDVDMSYSLAAAAAAAAAAA